MTHSVPPDRCYADDHLAELTDRQRLVLDLVVAGKTNAQIGEGLGITLDGAKWNVSEILTRLGFSSREEAADYWRARGRVRRQLMRPLRALLGLPLVVKAAGAAGAVAVAGLGAWWAFAGPGVAERASADIPPFYLEATVEVTTDLSAGSRVGGSAPSDRLNTTRSEFRWWFASQTEWRQEDETTVTVADGSNVWTYARTENTYTKSPLPELSDTPEAPATGPFFAFGPLRHRTIDDYLTIIRSTGRPPMQAAVVGSDKVLGFHTLIVEVKSGQTVTRIWVDPDHMFVLRAVVSDRISYHAEATTLRYNESVYRDRLRFEPPGGARLVDTHVTSSSGGGVGLR